MNTLLAYRRDLAKLAAHGAEKTQAPLDLTADDLRGFVDSLYRAQLSSRSIARHITTLRNFYGYFLAGDGTPCAVSRRGRLQTRAQTERRGYPDRR